MSIIRPLAYYPADFGRQLAATIVWAQFFVLYCLFFWFFSLPTPGNLQWADPLIKILPIQASIWLTILSSIVLGGASFCWLGSKALLKNTPFIQIGAGIAAAMAVAITIRILVGDVLPSFVPAEESSKPGFLYGMVAGYGEEVLFRMVLTPVFFFGTYWLLRARKHRNRVLLAATVAIVLTAVAFVLLHEAGEADGTIVWPLVATRFFVPGLVMGALFFLFGPGFVVAMHATMHIMIPLLFH